MSHPGYVLNTQLPFDEEIETVDEHFNELRILCEMLANRTGDVSASSPHDPPTLHLRPLVSAFPP